MTFGVKGIAFCKELFVAHRFGTSDEVDAFLVAALVPTIIAFIVGDAFRDAVMPAYAKLRIRPGADAPQLVSNALWISAGTLFVVTLAIMLLSGPLINILAPNFPEPKQLRSEAFLRLLFPFAICFGVAGVLKGYLQSHGHFAISSIAPAIVPACTIIVLLFTPHHPSGVLLAVSASIGAVLFLAILWADAKRIPGQSLLNAPRWDDETKSVIRHTFPLLAGAAVMEGCYFVDTMMASSLAPGSVATLSYGEKICTIVLAIAGTAAGQVLFPHISNLVAEGAWKPLSRVVFRFSLLIIIAALPCVLVFWVAADPIVRILLERGNFTPEDTSKVADVLRFASLQIPGYVLAVLGTRVVMALRASRFLLITTLLSLALNVGLNLLFIRWFGLKGIALATAVVTVFSAAMLHIYSASRIRLLITSNSPA